VKGAPSDGEDREQGGDDEQSASPGHVGRVCPSRLPVYRLPSRGDDVRHEAG